MLLFQKKLKDFGMRRYELLSILHVIILSNCCLYIYIYIYIYIKSWISYFLVFLCDLENLN